MAVNDTDITVVGWVGSDPLHVTGDAGQVPFARFRVASTPRMYDREHGTYVDGRTSWFTVKVFRQLARNVAESLRRGEPVIVHGRLQMVDWVAADGTTRTTAEVTADAVGHDLARGQTRFTRSVHDPAAAAAATAGAGGPGAGDPGVDEGGAPDDGGGHREGHGDVPVGGHGDGGGPDGPVRLVDVSAATVLEDDPEPELLHAAA